MEFQSLHANEEFIALDLALTQLAELSKWRHAAAWLKQRLEDQEAEAAM